MKHSHDLTGELQGSHDPSGVVFTVLAALSGMEREYIRDRTLEGHTLEGHESARARGKSIGGAAVTDLVRRVAEHQPPPRAVHHARVDQAAGDEQGGQLAPVGQDVAHRREHRRALSAGAELDHGGQHLQEPGHGRVPGGQRRAPVVRVGATGRRHALGDQRQRGAQLRARDDRLDRCPVTVNMSAGSWETT